MSHQQINNAVFAAENFRVRGMYCGSSQEVPRTRSSAAIALVTGASLAPARVDRLYRADQAAHCDVSNLFDDFATS